MFADGVLLRRDPAIGSREKGIAVQLAKICNEAGVQVFIYSGLPNANKISNGKYVSTHAVSKNLHASDKHSELCTCVHARLLIGA